MTQQTNDLYRFQKSLRDFSNGLGISKNTCGDQPLTEEMLASLEAQLRDIAGLFSSAIAGQRMQDIAAAADRLQLASNALGWEQRRAERARVRAERRAQWSAVKPGDTVIVRRHHQSTKGGLKLAIANDTAASFVGISRDGKSATVMLSGGCRASFRPSAISTLDSYKAGATRFSLIDPKHEDYILKTTGYAAHAIRCAQEGTL